MKESWHAVTMEIESSEVEIASHLLHELRCNGVIEDKNDGGRARIVAYFDATREGKDSLAKRIRQSFARLPALASTKLEIVTAAHADWQTNWRQYFKPFEIVPGVVVSPSWESDDHHPDGKTIILDPGMAFGTGLHETTRLCAKAINSVACRLSLVARKKLNFLDVGTGSGLLALVAHRLGIEKIVTVENDPDAAAVARENFEINSVKNIEVLESIADVKGVFDIVVANILLLTLIELKDELVSRVAPGGKLIMSGITLDQEEKLIGAFAPPLSLEGKSGEGEWRCVVFYRKITNNQDATTKQSPITKFQ